MGGGFGHAAESYDRVAAADCETRCVAVIVQTEQLRVKCIFFYRREEFLGSQVMVLDFSLCVHCHKNSLGFKRPCIRPPLHISVGNVRLRIIEHVRKLPGFCLVDSNLAIFLSLNRGAYEEKLVAEVRRAGTRLFNLPHSWRGRGCREMPNQSETIFFYVLFFSGR